jgi:hypothetical protein
MKYFIIMLVCLVMLSGCVTQDKPVYLTEDNKPTFNATPKPVYTDNITGAATLSPVDSSGKRNPQLKLEATSEWVDLIGNFTTDLPNPWGNILTGLVGIGSILIASYAGMRNRKRRLLLEELITSIENSPETKKAMKLNEKHSPELKKEVSRVT